MSFEVFLAFKLVSEYFSRGAGEYAEFYEFIGGVWPVAEKVGFGGVTYLYVFYSHKLFLFGDQQISAWFFVPYFHIDCDLRYFFNFLQIKLHSIDIGHFLLFFYLLLADGRLHRCSD